MKIRLTESQYDKLLKVVNQNKKLIITENQYKRLILESTDQFNGIEVGNGIKIIAGNKPYTFKVFAELNGEFLLRNVNPNKDGRYASQYFLIKPDGLKNNTLTTQKSKAILYDYNDINKLLAKEKDAGWKTFTFKNITSFEVFKNDKFKLLIPPKIDVNTGEQIDVRTVHEIDSDTFKDNLIRGIEPNHSYLLTFYDESTVKFAVTQKSDSIIDIEFETVNEKESMDSYEVDRTNIKDADVWAKNQREIINKLTNEIPNIQDPKEKANKQDELEKAINLWDDYNLTQGKSEGLKSISKTVYKGSVATKWIENLQNSVEYKNGTGIKIDLSKTIVNKQKIKTLNKNQDTEIDKLKQELASASTEEDKQKIEKELKNIEKVNTLHFFNPKFDVYDNVTSDTRTFDLIMTLSYRPEEVVKKTKSGIQWNQNLDAKIYFKDFSLRGIKGLTIVKDAVNPSLTDKREDKPLSDINNEDSLNMQNIEKLIKNDKGAQDTLLKKPGILASLFGKKPKGIIPNEELQRSLGLEFNDKKFNNKFTSGYNIKFETNLADTNVIEDNIYKVDGGEGERSNSRFTSKQLFDIFKSALKLDEASKYRYSGIGKVKSYSTGDRNVVINMYVNYGEYKILYSLFLNKESSIIISDDVNGVPSTNDETPKGKVYDTFKITLKASPTANTAKKEVAKFTVYIGVGDGFNGYKIN